MSAQMPFCLVMLTREKENTIARNNPAAPTTAHSMKSQDSGTSM